MADVRAHPGRHPTRRRLHVVNAFTCWILRSRWLRRLADHQVVELRFTGTRTGRMVTLPVMYAQRGDMLVVLVGGADGKRWWRNFTRPHQVQVLLRGVARTGLGHVAVPGSAERAEAVDVYNTRFPDIGVENDPIVIIDLAQLREDAGGSQA